jgi:hypothetical protein
MCVLKHIQLMALSPKPASFGICFNTLGFFVPHKELHRLGRPFEACLECASGSRFPWHYTTLEPSDQYATQVNPAGQYKMLRLFQTYLE